MTDDAGQSTPKRSRSLNVIPKPDAAVEALRAAPPVAPRAAETPETLGLDADRVLLHERVTTALSRVYDPEIPVNVYDLGLIYKIDIDERSNVAITMTLTAPACPMADAIVRDVKREVAAEPGVAGVTVNLVWSPPWDKSRMSEAAMLELGLL